VVLVGGFLDDDNGGVRDDDETDSGDGGLEPRLLVGEDLLGAAAVAGHMPAARGIDSPAGSVGGDARLQEKAKRMRASAEAETGA
jgi:hypothetical protein